MPERVTDAQGLRERLHSPDLATRLSLLRAIPRNATKADSYEGVDLAAELQALLETGVQGLERHALLTALASLDREGLGPLFLKEFDATRDAETMLLLAHRLAREPAEWLVPQLAARLHAEEGTNRGRFLATMLARQSGLDPETAVGVAVFSSVERPVPYDSATADAWVRALHGPGRERARDLLEGEEGLEERWADLSPENRRWLLETTRCPQRLQALLIKAWPDDPEAVLRILARHPEWQDSWRPLVAQAADGPLAALAAAAGAPAAATTPEVRREVLRRSHDLNLLLEALADPDWTVRGAAVEALVRLRPDPARLEPLLQAGDLRTRLAAAAVLQEL